LEHAEGDGAKMFEAVCELGLGGIISKRLTSVINPAPHGPGSR